MAVTVSTKRHFVVRAYSIAALAANRPMMERPYSPFFDAGLWLAFFGVIYIIILIKTATGSYLAHNLFFGIYSTVIVTYILSRPSKNSLSAPRQFLHITTNECDG